MADNGSPKRRGDLQRSISETGSVEKNPVEARQGFRGVHTLYILGASLLLITIAYFVIYFIL
jgi:hypothetical protein